MTVIFDKMILVAGSGRNVGKTTLACRLITGLSNHYPVTSIKVSTHIHDLTHQQKVIYQVNGLTISEEKDGTSSKDSSRFLRAGAETSLFIQVEDDHLPELVSWLKQNNRGWTICESGTLGKYIVPIKAIFIEGKEKRPSWNFTYLKTRLVNDCFTLAIDDILKE